LFFCGFLVFWLFGFSCSWAVLLFFVCLFLVLWCLFFLVVVLGLSIDGDYALNLGSIYWCVLPRRFY
ncbi:hypothetical protein Q0N68_13580, partial [Staphylococcus aureus]|nr:hypothetical protein [Staphylococcus aureus]